MTVADSLAFVGRVLFRHPLRTSLLLLAVAVGVASVVVLTSLGDSARRYVSEEFASLGTDLLIVTPGRNETSGVGPSMFMGSTPRDLTLDDALALRRSSAVKSVSPMVIGEASLSRAGRVRQAPTIGTTVELLKIRHWKMRRGRFLPAGDVARAPAVVVLGEKVRQELFGAEPALGGFVRVGDRRFRVIGILQTEGRSLGLDVDELVVLPVARAMEVFDTSSLFRIMVEARSRGALDRAAEDTRVLLKDRHQGEEDVTIVRQDAMVKTFDRVLRALTFTVGGIASVSLLVAGILLMNVMLVSVSQRTAEIGLLKAIGASRNRILSLFLLESGGLALLGALLGLALGLAGNLAIGYFVPMLTLRPPLWAVVAAPTSSLLAGVVFGLIPARRAAALDPIDALAGR
ncbi:MAG: ABC transporter permease [Deltaproteobacteria bacterium]